MSYIGRNIKKIRTINKLSQSQFGELFGLNRGAVGAYEEERSEPKIETLIQIASYFNLSIDILLIKELTTNELFKFNILNKKFDEAHHFSKDSNHKDQQSKMSLVSSEQSLEYVVNYDNKDFISRLPTIDLTIRINSASTYRAFEMEGSEMEYNQQGLHHGDLLITQLVNQANTALNTGDVYLIVTSDYIKTRRFKEIKRDVIVFSSDDPNYPILSVEKSTINQLWLVKGVYSNYLNPPKMIEERVMLLEDQMAAMEKKLMSLEP